MPNETTGRTREVAYRQWMRLARLGQFAAIPIMLGILVATYVGWLPHGIDNDHLVLIMLGGLGVTVFASWMAGRRLDAMLREWGRRRAVRMGFVSDERRAGDDR